MSFFNKISHFKTQKASTLNSQTPQTEHKPNTSLRSLTGEAFKLSGNAVGYAAASIAAHTVKGIAADLSIQKTRNCLALSVYDIEKNEHFKDIEAAAIKKLEKGIQTIDKSLEVANLAVLNALHCKPRREIITL